MITKPETGRWVLAASLAALAGYVDTIGFLKLGGLFVSFMSGNTTTMAVGMAEGSSVAAIAAGLIASFLIGVIAGSLLAERTARNNAVLALMSFLLVCSALIDGVRGGHWSSMTIAAGMGATNCIFQGDGKASFGITYVTGTLVKLGQKLAGAILGPDRLGWIPYLVLWSSLVAGAVIGASLYPRIGSASLWLAAIAAAVLAALAHLLAPLQPAGNQAAGASDSGR